MKIRLRSRKKYSDNIPSTPHGQILREVIAVSRKLEALQRFPANTLRCQDYVRATLSIDPRASLKGVSRLRAEMAKKAPSLERSQRALATIMSDLRGSNWRTTPPTKYPARINRYGSPQVLAELASCGSSLVELYALAAEMVGDSHPELWGTATSLEEHEQEVAALEARKEELFKQGDEVLGPNDLQIDPVDGNVPVTFLASRGEVPVAPRHDSGQRLVAYLMAQREERSAGR